MSTRTFILTGAVIYALAGLAYGAVALTAQLQLARLSDTLGSDAGTIKIHATRFMREGGFIEHSIAAARVEPLKNKALGGIVSHHIPTAIPLLANYYAQLKKSASVETFIIIGPDHFERGRGVSISEYGFQTSFGTVQPDLELIHALEKTKMVAHDETPFTDHAIHSQTPFISKLFPQARIVAILIRSDASTEQGAALGETIAAVTEKFGRKVFIIGSVDFSHYLPEEQARPLDEASARLVGSLDPQLAGLAEADSPMSLSAVVAAVKKLGAKHTISTGTYNSATYSTLRDFTTGYVFEFFTQ